MLAPDTPVLVLGARGLLGTDLCEVLRSRCRLTEWDIAELDISDHEAVLDKIGELNPAEVVNCAAYTDVDGCESHEEEATAVNGAGAGNVAEACAAIGARLIQISTDYVFDGSLEGEYAEEHPPNPINAYGRSKLAGELAIAATPCRRAILRTQWLYGRGGPNFIDKIAMLAAEREELSVVDDQLGRPTWSCDLAAALTRFLETDGEGVYHLAAGSVCSWYDIAVAIVKALGLATRVRPVPTTEFPRPARRPERSVLDCGKISRRFGIEMRGWKEALLDYLKTSRR